jgi:iron complex transport system permease protein
MALDRLGLFSGSRWWSDTDKAIVFDIRLPRAILGMLVGASLAVCGAAFQGLFRNPMADPFILGVSPGAALGAALAIVFRVDVRILGVSAIPLSAFAGGLFTSALVYALSRVRSAVPVHTLLLTGIAVGSVLSALTSLVMVLGQRDLYQVFFWIMGGLGGRTWVHVSMVLPYAALGILVILLSARELNLMLLGEEDAFHLGVGVERTKMKILVAASLAAAAAVAAAGVVGFVGLIVPHAVRLVVGPDHKVFLPSTLFAGGATLLAADMVARSAFGPQEIPLGVVTALLGAPFFLFLLRAKGAGK